MRFAAIIWMIAAAAWLRTAVVAADAPPIAPSLPGVPIWESHGFGRTEEEAKEDAFHHAAEKLQAKVAARWPDAATWKPSDELVRSYVIHGFPGDSIKVPPIGLARRWILHLRMPAEASLDVYAERESRRARAEARQRNTALAFGGAALLLAGGWGYRMLRARRSVA